MEWIEIISDAVETIENNLEKEISATSLAEKYYISTFYFQKMFSLICNCTVGEYIRNRRLSTAAQEIINTKESILNIALKFGYETNESFTRAFSRFHGCTPDQVRKKQISLKSFPRISPIKNLTGGEFIMSKLNERGYVVKEAGAVYYTQNMDKTLDWFKNVLGWYGQIDERNENDEGCYGCVSHIPIEMEALHIVPFAGIHMFKGEPIERIIGFMQVQGLEKLHINAVNNGWKDISEIKAEPWGAKSCTVKTIDGSFLKFFEITA